MEFCLQSGPTSETREVGQNVLSVAILAQASLTQGMKPETVTYSSLIFSLRHGSACGVCIAAAVLLVPATAESADSSTDASVDASVDASARNASTDASTDAAANNDASTERSSSTDATTEPGCRRDARRAHKEPPSDQK